MNSFPIKQFSNGTFYMEIDAKTAEKILKDGNKRAICTFSDKTKIHCAILKSAEHPAYIFLSKKNCKKLKLQSGQVIKANIEKDTSPYQFEMPEEFAEVLRTDEEAEQIFKSLTPGNQRGLIYLVNSVKTCQKKVERALKIADQLKRGITSPKNVL